MPPSVNMVIDSLHAKGFEAYAVGGCVRDTILAREPDDWDITTSASPQQVKEIFDRSPCSAVGMAGKKEKKCVAMQCVSAVCIPMRHVYI